MGSGHGRPASQCGGHHKKRALNNVTCRGEMSPTHSISSVLRLYVERWPPQKALKLAQMTRISTGGPVPSQNFVFAPGDFKSVNIKI